MSWCKSQRIILVFPQKNKYIPDTLDLQLILRSARMYGANISLVTRDWRVIESAEEVGIPVFSSIPRAEKANWGLKKPESEDKGFPKGIDTILEKRESLPKESRLANIPSALRVILFFIVILALCAMGAYTIPSAEIKIHPVTQIQSLTLNVTASPNTDQINLIGMIPSEKRTFELSLDGDIQSTGTVEIPQSKANGECVLQNLTGNELILPAGIILSTDGEEPIRFQSNKQVSLAAGGSETIEVEAILSGEEGNIDTGEIYSIEGIYGSMIELTNPEAFTGGSSLTVPSPTEEDFDRLRNDLRSGLNKLAQAEIKNLESETVKAINESLVLEKVLSEVFSSQMGEPSDTLHMDIKVQFSVYLYNPKDIIVLVNQILDSDLKSGLHVIGNSMRIEDISRVHSSMNHEYVWQVTGSRQVVDDWNVEGMKELIKGRKIDEAILILNNQIPHTEAAEISSMPGFWTRLPLLPGRINFEEVVE